MLRLQNRVKLRRESYANTRDKHTVPFAILRPYDHKDPTTRYALTPDSYQQLIDHAGFVSPAPLPCEDASFASTPGIITIPTNTRATTTTTANTFRSIPAAADHTRSRTYGTIPTPPSSSAGRAPLPSHYSRDLLPYFSTAGSYHHTPPQPAYGRTRPANVRYDTLPLPNTSAAAARERCTRGGHSRWSALVKLALVLGVGVFVLWTAWARRAELGAWLLRPVSSAGAQAFRFLLGKGGAAGVV